MAHHESTPQSVLDAPVSVPTVVSAQHGFSRQERRHGVWFPPGVTDGMKPLLLAEARAAGRNHPHIRMTPRVVQVRRIKRATLAAAHRERAAR